MYIAKVSNPFPIPNKLETKEISVLSKLFEVSSLDDVIKILNSKRDAITNDEVKIGIFPLLYKSDHNHINANKGRINAPLAPAIDSRNFKARKINPIIIKNFSRGLEVNTK